VQHDTGSSLVQIEIQAPPAMNIERAQIIDPVGVVGVLVGEKDAVEPIDIGIKQLLAQIGRRVDQHAGAAAIVAGTLDQERATAAPVARIGGIACTPAECGTRHSG